eukprot:COSAG06_NODE_828_length_12054_cov_67.028440_6_plen_122_part_00
MSVTEEEIEKMVLEIDEDGSGEKKKRRGKVAFFFFFFFHIRKERQTEIKRNHFQDKARQDKTRQGKTRQDKTGSGHARTQEILLNPKSIWSRVSQAPSTLMSFWPWSRRRWPTMLAAQAQS